MPRKPSYGPHRYQFELAKRNKNFETQIDQIIVNTEAKLLAVVKTAIQDTVEEAQVPVAKGGKMRVKTGFLRSSGVAALNQLPSGPGRGDPNGTYRWNGDAIGVVLAKLKIGDTFNFGWTANYAKYREAYDGFLESAMMNWQRNVDRAIRKLNGRTKNSPSPSDSR